MMATFNNNSTSPIVYIHFGYGTPTPGVWCEKCLLPSALIVPVLTMTDDGVTPFGNFLLCDECGTWKQHAEPAH